MMINFSSLKTELQIFFSIWLVLFFFLSPVITVLPLKTPEFLAPQSAQAIFCANCSQIVYDAFWSAVDWVKKAWHITSDWARDTAKWATEKSWDMAKSAAKAALKVAMHQVLAQVTNSIIKWIQSDFEGQPGFITDWQSYLKKAGDAAGGRFLNELAGFNLCSNFNTKLQIALNLPYPTFGTSAQCTLSKITSNIEDTLNDFYDNFENGGWSMFKDSLKPNNNAFGAWLTAIDEKSAREYAESKKLEKESKSGFKPTKRCLDPEGTNANSAECKSSITTSPDGTIEFTTNFGITSAMRTLEQEIAGLMGEGTGSTFTPYILAITNALISQLVKDGVSGLVEAAYQTDENSEDSSTYTENSSSSTITVSTSSDDYSSIITDAALAEATLTNLDQIDGSNSLVQTNLSQYNSIISSLNSIKDKQNAIITDMWANGKWTTSGITSSADATVTTTSGPTTSTTTSGSTTTTTTTTTYTITHSYVGEASITETITTISDSLTGTSTTTYSYAINSSKNQIEDADGKVSYYQDKVNTMNNLVSYASSTRTATDDFISKADTYDTAYQNDSTSSTTTTAQSDAVTARDSMISTLQTMLGSVSVTISDLNDDLTDIINTNTTNDLTITYTASDGTQTTEMTTTYYQNYYNTVNNIYTALQAL